MPPLVPIVLAASSLAGIWFGTGQPYDKGGMYLDRMLANGEIHSKFRSCRNGKPVDGTEDGNWSLKGDILTISVISHDGQFAPRVDTYRIVSITPDRYKEIFLRLNYPYDSKRVDAKFVMPSCEFVS